MAFIGIFMMYMTVFLVIIGVLFFSAVAFMIASIIMKHRYKKKINSSADEDKKPRKWYIIPRVLSILNFIPLVFIVIFIAAILVNGHVKDNNSLAHNVNIGNYERVEKLLKKGVSPDCTLESNEPAENGEQTLLSVLCENYGFVDEFDTPLDHEVTTEELVMIELLIDYGADIEAVSYKHNKDFKQHYDKDEYSFYQVDDKCGYTPLMYAVKQGSTEIAELLIRKGADVNARDYCGFTPVAIVADNLDDDPGVEILRMLIDNGANIFTSTNFGQSPQWLAYRQTQGSMPLDNDGIREIIGDIYN